MREIIVELSERSYKIHIENGSLNQTGSFVRNVFGVGNRKIGLVTNETVAPLYLSTVSDTLINAGYEVIEIIIPDGEEYKNLATYEKIITKLIEAKFERASVVIPLGGGVIGDIAGFVSATLLRGIPFIQIPTTILSQIDSSIGGKVAVDHPLGKNLIGSFYQPRGVLIDPEVLRTLNRREVVSGIGEAIKHAIIRDSEFFSFFEENLESIMDLSAPGDVIEEFIAWNCRIKAGVVATDEKERGLRAILNYGHTVGHALEVATGYNVYKHGEAVILGMVAASEIAVKRGILSTKDRNRQNDLLKRTGLKGYIPVFSDNNLNEAMKRDKKVSQGRIKFVLPESIGSAKVYNDISENEIQRGLEFMAEFASANFN